MDSRTYMTISQYNCSWATNVMQGLKESGGDQDKVAIQKAWIGKANTKNNRKDSVRVGLEGITLAHGNYNMLY